MVPQSAALSHLCKCPEDVQIMLGAMMKLPLAGPPPPQTSQEDRLKALLLGLMPGMAL